MQIQSITNINSQTRNKTNQNFNGKLHNKIPEFINSEMQKEINEVQYCLSQNSNLNRDELIRTIKAKWFNILYRFINRAEELDKNITVTLIPAAKTRTKKYNAIEYVDTKKKFAVEVSLQPKTQDTPQFESQPFFEHFDTYSLDTIKQSLTKAEEQRQKESKIVNFRYKQYVTKTFLPEKKK